MPFPCCGKSSRQLKSGRLALLIWAAVLAAPGLALAAGPSQPGSVEPSASAAEPSTSSLDNLTLGLGASGWNGDYGAGKTTNIDAVLLNVRYKLGGLRLTASIPWMRIASDGAVFTGVEGTPLIVAPKATVDRRVREGIADLTLGAAYLLPAKDTAGFDVDLIGRVKIPTASKSSELSTRRTDFAVGAEVSRVIGAAAPFVSVTYRSFGDTPVWRLKDGVATSVGVSYLFPRGVVGAVSYDYAQTASQYVSDSHEVVGSFSAPIPKTPMRLTGFLSGGLSRGAAAVSGGLSISLKL